MRTLLRAAAAFALTLAGAAAAQAVSYRDLMARPHGDPDAHLAYGGAPEQFGDLWLPKGNGPHPVVILIHGGCWLSELPGVAMMNPMAEALRAQGLAVWDIEYRRIGARGGGYPNTFLDVSAAADMLRGIAAKYRLDLKHVVAVGHSAGGHLAMWLAARQRLPKGSPLASPNPLPISGVVSLAGILDLKDYREDGAACGGAPTVDGITGAANRTGQDVYADTSPQALLPLGVQQVVVSGGQDHIVPPHWRQSYYDAATAADDRIVSLDIPSAGHFELIDPQSVAWRDVLAAIEDAAR